MNNQKKKKKKKNICIQFIPQKKIISINFIYMDVYNQCAMHHSKTLILTTQVYLKYTSQWRTSIQPIIANVYI